MDPYVMFTKIFLDIVFGNYIRQGMGENIPSKTRNEYVVASFCVTGLDNLAHGVMYVL